MSNKITIRDIAKLAGVSPATVSGVLNNSGKQTPATVNLIHKIMDEVGYVPRRNKLRAENKRHRGKIKEISLIIPTPAKNSFDKLIVKKLKMGMEKFLAERDVYLREIQITENYSKTQLRGSRGVITFGQAPQRILKNIKTPVISVFENLLSPSQVDIDNVYYLPQFPAIL